MGGPQQAWDPNLTPNPAAMGDPQQAWDPNLTPNPMDVAAGSPPQWGPENQPPAPVPHPAFAPTPVSSSGIPPVVVGTGEMPPAQELPLDPQDLLNLPPELRMPDPAASTAALPISDEDQEPIPLDLDVDGMVPTLEEVERDQTMTCPKCDYVQSPGPVCQMCGVIFAKIRAPHPSISPRAPTPQPSTSGKEKKGSALASIKGLFKG